MKHHKSNVGAIVRNTASIGVLGVVVEDQRGKTPIIRWDNGKIEVSQGALDIVEPSPLQSAFKQVRDSILACLSSLNTTLEAEQIQALAKHFESTFVGAVHAGVHGYKPRKKGRSVDNVTKPVLNSNYGEVVENTVEKETRRGSSQTG